MAFAIGLTSSLLDGPIPAYGSLTDQAGEQLEPAPPLWMEWEEVSTDQAGGCNYAGFI